MDAARIALPDRLLDTIEQLLAIPTGDLKATLTHGADVVAAATGAEKIDAFLYDATRDSLVAVGSSTQPLSLLQRKLGLDILPVSNGGRAVHVFKTGGTFVHGHLDEDDGELVGIKEALGVRSIVGVPLEIGGKRRGMLMLASRVPDYFTADDVRFAAAAGRWLSVVAHRAELSATIARDAAEQGRRAAAEELVTVVAHDLRNYLAPIGMRLEVLHIRANAAQRADDLEDIRALLASVERLGTLVDDVLDVARIEGGMYHVALAPVDLGALVSDAVASFATARHPLYLRVQEGTAIRIAGDAPRLRQTLENIIANAIQKSPPDAAVSIFVTCATEASGRTLARVEIIDQGPGIPADVLPHVFDRFYTRRRQQGGLGLGLYLAKRIAVLHGGDLTVESSPGAGARFSLVLPALPAPTDSR